MKMPSRRQFLRGAGTGLATLSLRPTDTRTDLYREPPSNASPTNISVRSPRTQRVQPTEWVSHTFGFETEGNEGYNSLRAVREAASCFFELNGTTATDFDRGWNRITEQETGGYEQSWQYTVPPLPRGLHSYEVELRFDEPVRTQGNLDRTWEGSYTFSGTYVVAPQGKRASDARARGSFAEVGGFLNELESGKDTSTGEER
jgi:hypothetical protein